MSAAHTLDAEYKKKLMEAAEADIPIRSSYLTPPHVDVDSSSFYLTIVHFTPVLDVSTPPRHNAQPPAESETEKLPNCFGFLTRKTIPDDCLAPIQMKFEGNFINVSFKSFGRVQMQTAEYRNLKWYHFAVIDMLMFQGQILNDVSIARNKDKLKILCDRLADFMNPEADALWYLIVPLKRTETLQFIDNSQKSSPGWSLIDYEAALEAVAAIRNFSGSGVSSSSMRDASNMFLSSYNSACYTVHNISSPTIKFSDSFPKRRSKHCTDEYLTFEDYYKKKLGFNDLDFSQDLFPARCLQKMHTLKHANFLLDPCSPLPTSASVQTAFVVPSLLRLHPLPYEIHRFASMYLATCWMFESLLSVAEMRDGLMTDVNNMPISSPKWHWPSIEALLEAVSFKAIAEGRDYNKLEFLGDTMLKLVATIHICLTHPLSESASLMELRYAIVCNTVLAKVCYTSGIYKYIRHWKLGQHSWRPVGFPFMLNFCKENDIEWKCATEWTDNTRNSRRYKMLADVVEAVLGAFFLAGGFEALIHIIHRLGIAPISKIHTSIQENGKDAWLTAFMLRTTSSAVENIDASSTALVTDMISSVEEVIDYTFENKTHALVSVGCTVAKDEAILSRQHLSFLGDALIDFLVIRQIYFKKHDADPGEWTSWRQKCYNQERICQLCISLGLHRFIEYPDEEVQDHVTEYIHQLNAKADVSIYGEGMYGSPIVLHQTLQCLVASTFIDARGSLSELERIWNPLLEPLTNLDQNLPTHPILLLNHHCSKLRQEFKLKLRQDPPMHEPSEPEIATIDAVVPQVASLEVVSNQDNGDEIYDSQPWKERKRTGKRTSMDFVNGATTSPRDVPCRKVYIVDIEIDGQLIATGSGSSERAARREAAIAALKEIEKNEPPNQH